MKKVNKLFTLLSACVLVTSLNAVKVEVMPTVGKAFNADKDSLKDTEILYGIRGSVFLNESVAVQAVLETSQDNVMSDLGKTDIERGSVNIVYEPNADKRIRPYAIVGFGGEKTHRVSTPRTNDDSQAFVNAGAGLKFGINKNIDIVTEARWLRKLENNDDDIIATLGIGAKIGESKKSVNKLASIPSVNETSEVENAISLAKFKEIYEKKPTVVATTPQKVVVTQPVVTQEPIAEAVYVEDESATTSYEEPSQDGYYVQMAALFKSDGEVLTNRLEKKDYPFVLHNVQRGGKEATLILVGPYESRAEAGVAIKFLKRLKKDAFVYHMN